MNYDSNPCGNTTQLWLAFDNNVSERTLAQNENGAN
jgi:hypothetical protein